MDLGHAVDLHHAAWHGAEPIQGPVLCHTPHHEAGLTAALSAPTVQVGIVHAATATGLAPAADHGPVTRAQVQVLIQAIHPAHGHHLYPDAGDHLAFWTGGASQGEIVT